MLYLFSGFDQCYGNCRQHQGYCKVNEDCVDGLVCTFNNPIGGGVCMAGIYIYKHNVMLLIGYMTIIIHPDH